MTTTIGNIVDLLDSELKAPLVIQEGESLNITGQLVDFAEVNVPKAGLLTFRVSHYDEAGENIINGVQYEDRLSEVAAGGDFTVKLDASDTVVQDTTNVLAGQTEAQIVALVWTWNDGVQVRTGVQLIRIQVQRVTAPIFTAP